MTDPPALPPPSLTWLYVPGDRPDRFDKALASGADEVIVDLEDAVAPAHKEAARDKVAAWLDSSQAAERPPIQVRINGLATAWAVADVTALIGRSRLGGLRVPKAESPSDVAQLGDQLPSDGSVRLHLLVESARGLEAAAELAVAHPLVASIGLGEADLSSELSLTDGRGLAWARGRIVVAAAAAGLPPPAMSVWTDLRDEAGLAASCRDGRALGFVGRAAIHPRQLPVIVASFLPDEAEIGEATAVLHALAAAEADDQGTAVLPDGRFVDRAMAVRAQRIVALAARRQPG